MARLSASRIRCGEAVGPETAVCVSTSNPLFLDTYRLCRCRRCCFLGNDNLAVVYRELTFERRITQLNTYQEGKSLDSERLGPSYLRLVGDTINDPSCPPPLPPRYHCIEKGLMETQSRMLTAEKASCSLI